MKRKMSSSQENLSPQVLQAIARELRKLVTKPLEGITVVVNEQNLTDIQADIEGPTGTPYEGGVFRCKLVLSNDFPNTPPRGFFLTKIFHPNVASNGDICVNTLKKDWSASLGMSHIFQVIRCLLIIPFPESALNEDASKMFLESYDEYAKRAKLMTSIHATRKCADSFDTASAEATAAAGTSIGSLEEKERDGSVSEKIAKRRTLAPGGTKTALEKKKSNRKRNLKRL
mmetsp:Transcript_14432/g.25847  ORF Transcript_14432/g.25847 Transcript_14432/m.25847 type:complete len:229 (+) Transcript_14432:393-1079(+)